MKFISKDGYEVEVIGETRSSYYLYCKSYGAMNSAPKLSVEDTYLRVCNIGFIDCNNVAEFKKIKASVAYKVWHGICARVGKGELYKDVELSPEWHYFSFFKKFHDENYFEGFVIDKDLRSCRVHKVYSAQTCSYIPQSLNSLIVERSKDKIPIYYDEKKNEYWFNYKVGGYTRPHKVKTKSLEDICRMYSVYRCTRILSVYSEYWKVLSDDVRRAIETLYDLDRYYERIYSMYTKNPYPVLKQIDDGFLW